MEVKEVASGGVWRRRPVASGELWGVGRGWRWRWYRGRGRELSGVRGDKKRTLEKKVKKKKKKKKKKSITGISPSCPPYVDRRSRFAKRFPKTALAPLEEPLHQSHFE
jgi:hypothetical protein